MLNRRLFLGGAAVLALSRTSGAQTLPQASMRGSIDAAEAGVEPGAQRDQTSELARLLREAAGADRPVFLPAGNYIVSRLELPARTRLTGVAGATRLILGGGGVFVTASDAELLELDGITFDGANQFLSDNARAAIDLRRVARLTLRNCSFTRSSRSAIAATAVAGQIADNRILDADDVGIYSLDAAGLAITGNTLSECGNGGILVHRSERGPDATIVSGNRITTVRAANGGTGQFGNGINVFRADDVAIRDNHIADCAFSAIRSNSGSNVMIAGNICLRSGETAIYSEFAFEGASITGNIVDGAANGISVVNFNEGGRLAVVSGNLVRNLSRRGPYQGDAPGFGSGIVVEADTTVSGNTIEGAPLHGIRIGWGPYMRNVVASGNVIRDVDVGIAVSVVDGVGPVVVSGNVIAEARRGAIVGHRWSDAVTADLVDSAEHGFAGLTVSGNSSG